MEKRVNLSVHDIVDFLLRTGDIDNRVYNQDTMSRGSEIHASYQRVRSKNYLSEYLLRTSIVVDDFTFNIEGRADGIILDNIPTIEELKSTIDDLDIYYKKNKDWHLGQAKFYGYMYLKEKGLDKINISLVYISQNDDSRKIYKFSYSFKELEKFVVSLLKEYLEFHQIIFAHKINRNITAENIKFPFIKFRNGQKEFIKQTYDVATNGGVCYIEAPTGIGKTISAIFPSVKSFANVDNDKIFYLTAKNTGKDAAYLACLKLIENGLDIGAIYITAKERICKTPGAGCNPGECLYAKDYYTNLKSALVEAIKSKKLYNHISILDIADKYHICPFEFSLDLSLYMDIVIADYNYFFDPIVHLDRYFNVDASRYFVLIDEAHNLLERAREMYSETISYSLFIAFKSDYRYANKRLKNAISRVNKVFANFNKTYEVGEYVIDDIDHETFLAISNLYNNINDYLKENKFHPNEYSIDFSRALNRFLKLYENIDEASIIYITKTFDEEISINLYCIDPSKHIKESLSLVKGATLFSATLSPIKYYMDVLGSDELTKNLVLPSPFPEENFKLMIAPVSVKYKDRDKTLNSVISFIDEFINYKKGNYLIFAPSFEYLDKLAPFFMDKEYQRVYIQSREMDDNEKKEFLSHFYDNKNNSVIGLVVVGGAFSEGIDLVADSLIGVVVIGVGLPTISFKSNLIKEYYDKNNINGYSYAYKHPGMNKVTQAVGRLIRSETDKGAALLIDTRYLSKEYRPLFKKEWNDYDVVTSKKDIKEILKLFYKE